jgi:hypothetical protein
VEEIPMTTDQIAGTKTAPQTSKADIFLDGLFAGMIGALVVAAWFLVLDLAAGRPLWTPSLLGNVLLHGTAVQQASVQPLEVAAYTAFHFVVFIVMGMVLSYLTTLFERFPIMFFVLLVLFLCLQAGFFVLDTILGARLMNQLRPWTVVAANLLAAGAMALFLWKRHPSVLRNVEHMWEENQ